MLSDGGYELTLEGIPNPITVRRALGREAVNRLARWEVDVTLPGEAVADGGRALLGLRARLDLGPPEAFGRRFGGVVARVTATGTLAQGEAHLRLVLAPPLERLRHSRRSRIFQELDARTIVSRVLDEHGVPHRFALAVSPQRRTYCVQYRETDLAFVRRLLADEGHFFFHEDPLPVGTESVLVIADAPTAYLPLPGLPLVVREGETAMTSEEHHVRDVSLEERTGPRVASLRAHDWARPSLPFEAQATRDPKIPFGFVATEHTGAAAQPAGSTARLPVDEWTDHHEDASESTARRPAADPWPRAAIRLEQARREATLLRGTTACRRLGPGMAFALADHDLAAVNGAYALASIEITAVDPKIAKGEAFVCRFSAVPAVARLRPKRPKKPLVQVAETATVVGAAGTADGEPHVDAWGRVKVRFPWDREATGDEGDSCWIRVTQAWAGAGFGAQFIPRVGMEVLVTFLGGDPDCPVVTGALPNAKNPPLFPLPEGAGTSGIRTRSVPDGGGGNELSFSDTRGAEMVLLKAQHDMKLTVEHDLDDSVGGARRVITAGGLTTRVDGHSETSLGSDHDCEVLGDEHHRVMGDRTAFVLGSHSAEVAQHARLTVGGGLFVTAGGAGVVEVKDDAVLRVGSGNQTLSASAEGRFVLMGTRSLELTSLERIELRVGANRVILDEDGIKIEGKVIGLGATTELTVEGPGPKVTLGEEAEIAAKKITIFGEKGDFTLGDKGAQLRGENIKLAKPGTPPKNEKEEEKPETKKVKLRFADANFEGYADKHYVAMAGKERLEGSTGVDGEVELEVPKDATKLDVRVWIDAYPTGRTKLYVLTLEPLADAATPRGTAQRLKNLGYASAALPPEDAKELTPEYASALRWFQKDHELEETGALDDATKGKLTDVQGE